MTLDDLKKLSTSSLLFSLDRIIAPRLINILYLLGLAAIALWSVSHFFATFSFSFGDGLWGLLEIAIFGLLGFVGLRIVCEALIVYFKSNEGAVEAANQPSPSTSLIDDVRDAIEELAEEDLAEDGLAKEDNETVAIEPPAPTRAAPKRKTATRTKRSTSPRRTAKRAPASKDA